MTKKACILTNVILFIWFVFDMTGLKIGKMVFVEAAWKENGAFLLVFLAALLIFIWKAEAGKYVLSLWLLAWGSMQFLAHWYHTIFGAKADDISSYNRNFLHTYHVIPMSPTVPVPDFYHMVLHALILAALISVLVYWIRQSHSKEDARLHSR